MTSYVLGEFPEEAALLAAARALRAKGFGSLDLHSPYPLHGAEEALGLKRSTVPIVALVAGVTGATLGYLLQWWTVGVDWGLLFGSMSTFGVLFMLFLRFMPAIPIAEVKELRKQLEHEDHHAAKAAEGA